MKKTPTLFVRDPDNRKHVLPSVTPGCEWVIAGEGTPTRKYDGTCVMFDGTAWWARREVKPSKEPPADFVPVEHDEITGKTVGWEPADQSGFWRWLDEAIRFSADADALTPGTYELCGPKINGNPEGFDGHYLVNHTTETDVLSDPPRDFDELRDWLLAHQYEGIVWHHPDGRMCKLKKRDFSKETNPC